MGRIGAPGERTDMHDATLFLVRVWRDGRDGFRASARRVGEEEPHLFGEAEALARFLADARDDAVPTQAATSTLPFGDGR
jgi:hypothetical protein